MKRARQRFWQVVALGFTGASILGTVALAQDQSAPAAPAAQVPEGGQKHNTMRPAIQWKRFDYTCENNAKVTVYLRDTIVKVSYQEHLYLMKQTESASGTRYSDGKVVWWSKGNDGFLQQDDPNGDGEKIVKDCYLDKTATAAASVSTVSGTITYLVRMALPPQAVVQVQLQDVSGAGAPATIAEEKFTLGQHGVPVPFTLKYDKAKIDAQHTYTVSARISLEGELRFVSKEPYKALTQGNPSKIDMILMPAGGGAEH